MSNIEVQPAPPSPIFTVVVPVHTKADCLERSLECVYDQTSSDLEIIAVDDSFTDN